MDGRDNQNLLLNHYAFYSNIIVRYADDGVFFFKDEEIAQRFVVELNKRVASFGLSLNMPKTNQINFNKKENSSFDFLGFTFYWARKWACTTKVLKIKTSKLWVLIKAKLLGHYQYFGYAVNLPKLNHFYQQAAQSVFKWLNRRSQKRSFTWKQFYRLLGFNLIPKPPLLSQLKHFKCAGGVLYV